jgi:hypothetical protein
MDACGLGSPETAKNVSRLLHPAKLTEVLICIDLAVRLRDVVEDYRVEGSYGRPFLSYLLLRC